MQVVTKNQYPFNSYKGLNGVYDEIFLSEGSVRDNYKALYEQFRQLNPREWMRKNNEVKKLFKEIGATYNFYSQEDVIESFWQMEAMPLKLHQVEWNFIQKGIEQRAAVLSLLLKDLYTDKRILREKVIPSEILFSSKSFIRQVDGHTAFKAEPLLNFASDLLRDKDGNLHIMGDKVQSPSGSGYVKENRVVTMRMFSNMYERYKIKGLDSYFFRLKQTLLGMADTNQNRPLVVLLTPGPKNETFFDHTFLADELDLSLAQGSDIFVNKGKVFLRTVEGEEEISLIFKRVNDLYVDPLELKPDSLLGVPGVLQCFRQKTVNIANVVGCAILENRALLAYMDKIFEFYIQEKPILPVVPTQWLGTPTARELVFSNISKYVIKSAQRDPVKPKMFFMSDKSEKEQNEIIQKILIDPGKYVAQEILPGSTSPVFRNGNFVPGRTVFRFFASRTNDDDYNVLPGSLVRVNHDYNNPIVKNQYGATSRDLWVTTNEVEKQVLNLISNQKETSSVSLHEESLSRRNADNLYWMGRYTDRMIYLARFLKHIYYQKLSLYIEKDYYNLEFLLCTVSHYSSTYPGFLNFSALDSIDEFEDRYQELLFSETTSSSLFQTLQKFLVLSKAARGLPEDVKYTISRLEKYKDKQKKNRTMLEYLSGIISNCLSFYGYVGDSLLRDNRWTFIKLGKRIERASNLLRLVIATYKSMTDQENSDALKSLVAICDIKGVYKSKFGDNYKIQNLLAVLIYEMEHPACLCNQLNEIYNHIKRLNRHKSESVEKKDLEKIEELQALVQEELPAYKLTTNFDFTYIYKTLHKTQTKLNELSLLISETYFHYNDDIQNYINTI
ncbi:MAG: circularly permuted type 2 ATP-grasp protein [Spirochaetota bacterium]